MKITNISEKVIGFGDKPVLPGDSLDVPAEYEGNPIIDTYKDLDMITVSGASPKKKVAKKAAADDAKDDSSIADLRKAQLEALPNMSDEEVAGLAKELGVDPASCKTQADVRKKVEAALSK